MEEQPSFDEQQGAAIAASEQPRFKTLGVRLEESLHAQLSFITQLTGNTLADEIRDAIQSRVIAAQTDPDLVARAEAARAEIEREAAARRQAIAGFFGSMAVSGSTEEPAEPAPRSGNGQPRRPRAGQ